MRHWTGNYKTALRTPYGKWLVAVTLVFASALAMENYYLHAHNFRIIEEADKARNSRTASMIAMKDATRLLENIMDPVHDMLIYQGAAPENVGSAKFLAEVNDKSDAEKAAFSSLEALISGNSADFPPDIYALILAEFDFQKPRMYRLMELFRKTGTLPDTRAGKAEKARLTERALEEMEPSHHHLDETIKKLNRRVVELRTEYNREAMADFEEQGSATRRTKRGFFVIEFVILASAVAGLGALGKIYSDDEKLREEEQRYRRLLELEGDAIFVADAETGIIVDANRRAAELLKIPRERLIGMHQTELHPPERREEYARLFREHSPENGPLRGVLARRSDGADIPIDIMANTAMLDKKPVVIGIFRDMSYYTEAERKLRENANFLETLLNSIPNPVFYMDARGRYLGCNRSFEEWFGLSREDVAGKTAEELTAPGPLAQQAQRDRELLDNPGETQVYESQVNTARGESRDVVFYKTCFLDSRGALAGLVGVVLDITDRKKWEAEQLSLVRQTVDALEEAQNARKNAEEANRLKSEFLANMSHELRTPLTSVLGYANILGDRHDDLVQALDVIAARVAECGNGCPGLSRTIEKARKSGEDAFTFNNIVLEQGKHLLKIINDLMDLSLLDAGMMYIVENVASARMIVYAVGQTHSEAARKKGITLNVEIGGLRDRDILFYGDSKRIEQALNNLAQNAIKYSERGEVSVRAEVETGRVVFRVSDQGVGISEMDRESLFENFRQIDGSSTRRQGGLGMGLAISKKLARAMGGDLTLDSVPGKGSVFSLSVPYRPAG